MLTNIQPIGNTSLECVSLAHLSSNQVFKRKIVVKWHCANCGYVFQGTEAPRECPACRHPQAFYELLAENY